MRAPYDPPAIQKLQPGQMNSCAAASYYGRRVRDSIDGVTVDELVKAHGSPLFVFSERVLRRRFCELRDAFAVHYPNVAFAWSYKTNYLPAICAALHQEGALAEVVSAMEYQKARALGMPGNRIIFNGPRKTMAALEQAVVEGAQIHVDHLDEVADLEAIAAKLGRVIPVGLRLTLDAGIQPQWSRFGFALESGQAFQAAQRLKSGGRLAVAGLHTHIGTYIMDPQAYGRAAEKMALFAQRLRHELGFVMEYLDLGGGFPSASQLRGAYLPPDVSLPPLSAYAESISRALLAHLPKGEFPRLILEAGRAVVDEAGTLITSVHAAKRLPDNRRAYVLDAGVNLLYTGYWYKFGIELERDAPGPNEPSVLYGPLCMNIDVVDESVSLPPLPRGARLLVSPVGAYNVTQWMQFIEYRPAVVMIGVEGQVDVIREGEDLSDLQRREKLPERLRLA